MNGILYGLICGIILSIFSFDDYLIEVLQPFATNFTITTAHYYVLFAVLGFIEEVVRRH